MKDKIPAEDWRRQGQETYLVGLRFTYKDYNLYSAEWEHDHCEFCGVKFSLIDGDLNKGYSTEDEYHWICSDCFNDFKDEFKWQLNEKL